MGTTVKLIDEDGNVFAIIGAVQRALRRDGRPEDATAFVERAMAAESYDEVLQIIVSDETLDIE